MPRIVAISKEGNTTFVKIKENDLAPQEVLSYNETTNLTLVPGTSTIKIHPTQDHQAFFFKYEEMDDNYGASNAEELLSFMAQQFFFVEQ